MAELTHKERLQPSLLDRITDEDPHDQGGSGSRRELTMSRLRECVQRDLEWLLNTVNLESGTALDGFDQVRSSVLNFGMPDLAGHTGSDMDIAELERRVRQAIWDFDPRLLKNSVKVRAAADQSRMNVNALVFEIEGDLWAQPVPLQIYLRSELDLESGAVKVSPGG